MTNSASDQHDDMVLEPVPTDLLPIHQRLEDDGGSWRACAAPARSSPAPREGAPIA